MSALGRLLAVRDDRGLFAGLAALLLGLFVSALLSRYDEWGGGTDLAFTGVAALLVLAPAIALERGEGPPPGWLSTTLVVGFGLTAGALFSLADVLGANTDDAESSTITWISAVLAAAFAAIAVRRDSAICAFLAASSAVVGILAGIDWVFSPDGVSTYRYVLLGLGLVLAAAGLALYHRYGRRRHGVLLVVLSGLTILGLAGTLAEALLAFAFDGAAQGGVKPTWEAVVLAFGLGLAVFAAHTREPGPGYVAVALLFAFLSFAPMNAEERFLWWPLALLVATVAAVALFLRPGAGRPAPPQRDDPADVTREVRL